MIIIIIIAIMRSILTSLLHSLFIYIITAHQITIDSYYMKHSFAAHLCTLPLNIQCLCHAHAFVSVSSLWKLLGVSFKRLPPKRNAVDVSTTATALPAINEVHQSFSFVYKQRKSFRRHCSGSHNIRSRARSLSLPLSLALFFGVCFAVMLRERVRCKRQNCNIKCKRRKNCEKRAAKQ